MAVRGPPGQHQAWPPPMAEMAADGSHCTLSFRTAQVVPATSLQAFSDRMRRGMTFALALVARVRTSAPAGGTVARSRWWTWRSLLLITTLRDGIVVM